MHPVVVLCHNNVHLSEKAVQSAKAQDIGNVVVLAINNGSTDGTAQWLQTEKHILSAYYDRTSVAQCWNRGIRYAFLGLEAPHVLVINNDVELGPDLYRKLVEDPSAFVTGIGTSEWREGGGPKSPHPDFACFLIRRQVWDTVGPFDEHFLIAYAEDCDYHVRLYQAGIEAYALDVPYLHHGSQVLKQASLPEIRKIQAQAEKNREYFFKKWGFRIGSPEYDAFFKAPCKTSDSPVVP
jgi:GT2 family glycosyltransferase